MNTSDSLIRTKLRLPLLRQNLVARPRLVELLASGLRGPLTMVVAPAGFGKTTLAAASLAACGLPAAWLSLDKDDNHVNRFLKYLIAAVQTVLPRAGVEAAGLVDGIQAAPAEAVLTGLINDLEEADAEIVLALDDYHLISSPEVGAAATFLIDHLPPRLHVLIAGRSDPALPIARLRARGQAVELRAADLRFTAEEASAFLNEVMGLDVDAASAAALTDRTEGWAAGLQMAALSLRDRKDVRSFIEKFSGTNRFILDYLLEEVLAGQPSGIQDFLLNTSILERLSGPLSDALLDGDAGGRSASILNELEHANLFVIPLDEERIWFRYHQLFADLLRSRLQQLRPDSVSTLHVRASAWLESKGFIPEAVQHLFAAHEIDRAADLIEPYGPERWAQSDPSVVEMAESLPQEALIARPRLGLYLAWLLICQGHIPRALPLLHELAAGTSEAAAKEGLGWVSVVAALALAFLAPPDHPAGKAALPEYDILEQIPAHESILRNAADLIYGMLLERRGELERAIAVGERCVQRERSSPDKSGVPGMATYLAVMYMMQGRLRAAVELCRDTLNPVQEEGIQFVSTAGNMNVVLASLYYEWNRLEEAEGYVREGLRINEPWHNIMTDALGLFTLARILQAKGDFAGALRVAERFEVRVREGSQPVEFAEELRTLRARLQLDAGDLQTAGEWAEAVLAGEDFKLHPDYYRLTLAHIRLAQGRFNDVEALFGGSPFPSMTGSRISGQIESKLLLAAAMEGRGRGQEAMRLVGACLKAGEPEGYMRAFLDAGDPARELLTAYLRSPDSAHRPYALRLLEAFSGPGEPASTNLPPANSQLIEPLTDRELEVLSLMASGLTNQQIARQLIVAPGTIKAHTAGIFRKLAVSNRTEAAARAREIGLLT